MALGGFCGSYQLLDEIGTGGVAHVYRGRHIHPAYAERTFAVKTLRQDVAPGEENERFSREAFVLSMIKHANIVETFEAGMQGDEVYIAMEFVDGKDLHTVLHAARADGVPTPIGLYIAAEMLKGLAYAHALRDSGDKPLGLIHHDIKPSNVLIGFDGRVKLTDFGVARLAIAPNTTDDSIVLGTRGYFAPEMLAGEPYDHRADLFAVGVVLFELLSGRNLFEGDDTAEVLRKNRKSKIPSFAEVGITLAPELEAVVQRALERKPQKRFASGQEMLLSLLPFLPHPTAMSLALAAWMRSLFAAELRAGTPWRQDKPPKVAGRRVAMVGPDGPRMTHAREGLLRLGCDAVLHPSQSTLAQSMRAQAPAVLITDVAQPVLTAAAYFSLCAEAGQPVPVVAVADELDGAAIRAADAFAAVDLVVGTPSADRLELAIRRAIAGQPVKASSGSTELPVRSRVLIVGAEPTLATSLATTLAEWSYAVDTVATDDEAVAATDKQSHDAVIYAGPPATATPFIERFRRCAGMGIVPCIVLLRDSQSAALATDLPSRCTARSQTESPVVLAGALNQLRALSRLGRTFARYACDMPGEVFFGGRVIPARLLNLSRGGALVGCEQLVAVDTPVRLMLRLGGENLSLRSLVARLELPSTPGLAPTLGLVFDLAQERTEPLITFIKHLATTPE